jgi:dipeptidyl aminopeptidase/acylaminoacyl peptidase
MVSAAKAQEREVYFSVEIPFCELKTPPRNIRVSNGVFSDHAILMLPEGYSQSGKPTRLVYLAHGAGGGVGANDWFLKRYALHKLLLENGYAVFDVNGGSVENMGGELAVTSAFHAYRHILAHYNIHPKIIVGGFSMGGLTSTNFVDRFNSIVLAHVMYCPVLDLFEQVWKKPWLKTTRKALSDVYNFEDREGIRFDSCVTRPHNPLQRNTFKTLQDEIKIYPVPVKIWHASRDNVVDINPSRLFCQRIQRAGGEAELVEIDSDDHGLSCGNEEMNRELLTYIQRYN